eukprot:TRINITY_DN44147_c0_g1_i1.p1 TRINITY_DN44147_c0_g1~~TRINITY_DN44147_c0_g1_i1.p1  ORF type:complete len:219 (+),score=63.25 TRINITY_DN44147_c0_g1_i1:52-708(+)
MKGSLMSAALCLASIASALVVRQARADKRETDLVADTLSRNVAAAVVMAEQQRGERLAAAARSAVQAVLGSNQFGSLDETCAKLHLPHSLPDSVVVLAAGGADNTTLQPCQPRAIPSDGVVAACAGGSASAALTMVRAQRFKYGGTDFCAAASVARYSALGGPRKELAAAAEWRARRAAGHSLLQWVGVVVFTASFVVSVLVETDRPRLSQDSKTSDR